MWMWSTGINRNIVECKVSPDPLQFSDVSPVLIETLWNVKLLSSGMFHPDLQGINRNIVECKVV